jgi:hypothetical protein
MLARLLRGDAGLFVQFIRVAFEDARKHAGYATRNPLDSQLAHDIAVISGRCENGMALLLRAE